MRSSEVADCPDKEEVRGSSPLRPTSENSPSAKILLSVVRHWCAKTPRPGRYDLAVSVRRNVGITHRRGERLVPQQGLDVVQRNAPAGTRAGSGRDKYGRCGLRDQLGQACHRARALPHPVRSAADACCPRQGNRLHVGGLSRPSIDSSEPAERSSVPNWVRQDDSRYQRDLALAEKSGGHEDRMGIVPWNDLQAVQTAYDSARPLVDFSRS